MYKAHDSIQSLRKLSLSCTFLDVKLILLGRRNLHFDRPSQELLPHPYRQELFFTSSPVDFGPLVILRYLIKTHGETDTIG
ncbi:MAG: hypothetical protein CME13_19210 [Gemmatimonadetes bacterium]|jgi:hypothetical protein|nr:hypothetical protein [Gemmatimonadota bacterium]